MLSSSALISIFCVLIGAVGVFIIVWLVEQKLSYNDAREYRPHQYTEKPSGICLKLEPIIDFCPQEKGGSRAEAQRSDDDLKSQREMADWAFGVVVISAGGFFLSLVGVVLIFATFRATGDQLKISEDANRLAKISIEGRLQRREARFEEIGGKYVFTYRVRNPGQTYVMSLGGYATVSLVVDETEMQLFRFPPSEDMRDIAGHSDADLKFTSDIFTMTTRERESLKAGNLAVRVNLELSFSDVSGANVSADEKFHGRLIEHQNGHILADLRPNRQPYA